MNCERTSEVRDAEARARQQKRELRKKRRALEARALHSRMMERNSSTESPTMEHRDGNFQRPIGVPMRPLGSGSSPLMGRRVQSFPNRLSEIKAMNATATPPAYSFGGQPGPSGVQQRPIDRSPGQAGALLNALERQESRHGRPRK